MSGDVGAVVAKKLGANVNPFEVIQTMVEAADRWVTEVQRAKTDRAEIEAWEAVQTKKIHAQEMVLLKALDLTFDERRENFRRLFDGLDTAMVAGDAAITDLAKASPFKELANLEIIVAELKRPDQVWEV
jgi:hypothetical protein